jgi:hypothetical protein
MSTKVYRFLAQVYYVLYKGGLSTSATSDIYTIYVYFAISFFPDEDDESYDPSSPSSSSLMTNVNGGLHVNTVGHLKPRNKFSNEANWSFDTSGFSGGGASAHALSKVLGNSTYQHAAAASENVGPLGVRSC